MADYHFIGDDGKSDAPYSEEQMRELGYWCWHLVVRGAIRRPDEGCF